jgi:hypothetical protein
MSHRTPARFATVPRTSNRDAPRRAMSRSREPRNDRPIESRTAASIQLVFPEPFSPRRRVEAPSIGAQAA